MSPNRRRVLVWLGLAVAAAATSAWPRRMRIARWLVSGALGGEATGPLRPSTADTLRAATLALLDARIEPEHYLESFRWRAENLRGARALYERFADEMDRRARRAGARGFAAAPRAMQTALLAPLGRPRGQRRFWRLAFARDEARWSHHVVRPVFRQFARTDAWRLAGYPAWPGMPRAVVGGGTVRPPA